MALNLISFARPRNVPKLKALIKAADNNINSHFLDVLLGIAKNTDAIIVLPIIKQQEQGVVNVSAGGAVSGARIGGASSQFSEFAGIDPNLNPELVMALQISLVVERARQVQPQFEAKQQQQQPEDAQQYQQLLYKLSISKSQ